MCDFLKKAENIFLIICLCFGILFAIINPPFMASDETSHIAKIYNFTEGSVNFQKYTAPNGNTYAVTYLPTSLKNIIDGYEPLAFNTNARTSFQTTKQVLNIKLDKQNKLKHLYFIPSYTFFSYLPGVVVLSIMKMLNVPPLWMMYVLRLCSLLAYSGLTYLAIKIKPVKKWLFLMCALIPTMIYNASAINTDGLIAGLCFLFTACVFNLAFNNKITSVTKKDLIILNILLAYITICKFPYSVLILLCTLIDKQKFPAKTKYIAFSILGIFVYTLSITAYTLWIIKGTTSIGKILPVSTMLNVLITHPDWFLQSLVRNLDYILGYMGQAIGAFGWQNRFIQLYIIVFYYVFLLIAGIFSDKDENIVISAKTKLVSGLVYFLFVSVTTFVCWLMFSFTEHDIIRNFQGRYLISLFPLLFLIFTSKKSIKYSGIKTTSLMFLIFALVLFGANIVVKFYHVF